MKKSKSKKPSEKDKERVRKLVSNLEVMFQTTNYDLGFIWKEHDLDDEPTVASVDIDESYQRIVITVYPKFWTYDRDNQRGYILDEMCHVLIHPVAQLASDLLNGKLQTWDHRSKAVERATSHTTQLIECLMTGGYKTRRKAFNDYLKK